MLPEVTRFAPSPTGDLHLGHAAAAIRAYDAARTTGGRFLLRIEDIDAGRCRPEYVERIFEDLAWLGLRWEEPVRHQSAHLAGYQRLLQGLVTRGLAYPCFCTRGDILEDVRRMSGAPHGLPHGLEAPLYPGTCRHLAPAARAARLADGAAHALRLDVTACMTEPGVQALFFDERGRGPGDEMGKIDVQAGALGDIVLGRKDIGVSYHLAVVADDADQGVTLVTRGSDLFTATHVQRLLQAVLRLPAPAYAHHALVLDASGRRLAKRDPKLTLAALRSEGVTPADIRVRLGLPSH